MNENELHAESARQPVNSEKFKAQLKILKGLLAENKLLQTIIHTKSLIDNIPLAPVELHELLELVNCYSRKMVKRLSLIRVSDENREQAAKFWSILDQETPLALRRDRWYDYVVARRPNFVGMLKQNPKTRIYLAGCGRSGTWLTLCIMKMFQDTYVCEEERHYGHFGVIDERPEKTQVVKRNQGAYRFLKEAPETISIMYLLRDPRDVLTSSHNGQKYYISIERWSDEMRSFKELLNQGRKDLFVLKFEDIIESPDKEQQRLASNYGLSIENLASQFYCNLKPSKNIDTYMNGVRPIDSSVVGRWRSSVSDREYLSGYKAHITRHFGELASRFGYNLSDW
jgi:hypothetical protein